MTAAVAVSDVPSGDDYMIIDLTKTSDNVTYEGLFATQEESNKRYNIGNYKNSTRILLRKVYYFFQCTLKNSAYPRADGIV